MAKVIAIGRAINDAERHAIATLRDYLPDSYTVIHNFEISREGDTYEIDLAVLAPHAVYLADVKGTGGVIDVYGPKWYPEGRTPFASPLAKLRGHAKAVKGFILASQPGRQDLNDIYVDAAIILTAPDAHVNDRDGRDGPSVATLRNAAAFFQNTARLPARASGGRSITSLHPMILRALHAKVRPPTSALRFGNWEVLERLGATDRYSDYRAFNSYAGKSAGSALLRVYKADPYLQAELRKAQADRIANAYRALSKLPAHPSIVTARDFFPLEGGEAFVFVTDDVAGQALTVHLARPQLALTADQKWRIARELLSALGHAHAHKVIHRNLTPACVLVGLDGVTRLIGFDFARAGEDRSLTIAAEIVDDIEPAYVAPEAYREPSHAGAASDIFSAGLLIYELFTGDQPFSGTAQGVFDAEAIFPIKPSQLKSELPSGFDEWLQQLCLFDSQQRPLARDALQELDRLLSAGSAPVDLQDVAKEHLLEAPDQVDYEDLPAGYALTHKFLVQKRLGRGSFSVVYKVIDTLGDVPRALKLVLRDRHSVLDRLKREYRELVKLPEHPNVVRVLDADKLIGADVPYIVFEYVEGSDVAQMIKERVFSPEDALELGKQVLEGLCHLHKHGIHHCDIKPANLLWTERGARIIDFNVSMREEDKQGKGGGSRRYLPPDFDPAGVPSNGERADRDLYALGLTLYEAVTGRYPWEGAVAPPGQPAPDPRETSGFADLASDFVQVVLKAVAPKRADRFHSAIEMRSALLDVRAARRPVIPIVPARPDGDPLAVLLAGVPAKPNTNPFVSHLLTLYSQSKRTNAGTRGLDAMGDSTYVETGLDKELLPAVLAGEFRLVLISGNAGDGKTAFLQKLEKTVETHGCKVERRVNGSEFVFRGRRFQLNYDGSQDEGSVTNDEVLEDFFSPYRESEASSWSDKETRLIAINEGRLVDFLATKGTGFSALTKIVQHGLATGTPEQKVAVINLNLRSVVADAMDGSILERTLQRMTDTSLWAPCQHCDIRDKCYALHNARTFQDETAGPHVLERLKTLYTMTHLRGLLHITMRDLRSALAFTLVGTRDCDEIHSLYARADRNAILESFYFNSWMGGESKEADRLLQLLAQIDIGANEDPRFDRNLDFVSPDDRGLFRFEKRSQYDREALGSAFTELPRDYAGQSTQRRAQVHRHYVASARRRHFFERRDGNWKSMLPYRSAQRLVGIVRGEQAAASLTPIILTAINRGEGLTRPERLAGSLALQVRQVEAGTIRSYRLFSLEQFQLSVQDDASRARFVEHLPTGLVLSFSDSRGGISAELQINLDMFEMLERLNEGYRPSVEEMQGYYFSLAVFKNCLNAMPYREIMLTTTGHDFYRIQRRVDGKIEMQMLKEAS